jgi:hypothetical protein
MIAVRIVNPLPSSQQLPEWRILRLELPHRGHQSSRKVKIIVAGTGCA